MPLANDKDVAVVVFTTLLRSMISEDNYVHNGKTIETVVDRRSVVPNRVKGSERA